MHSAIPGVRAKQLCPHGIFVTPGMEVYAAVSAQVRAVFDRWAWARSPSSGSNGPIGDVQRRREAQLVQAFADSLGPHLFVLANAIDPRDAEPLREARSIGHEMTFADDLVEGDEVCDTLLQLSQMVGR